MSGLFEGLTQADEDPGAGYQPSYSYFSEHDVIDEPEPEGHWTVTGHTVDSECHTDHIDHINTPNNDNDNDCDGDLVIVEPDSYKIGSKITNRPSGSVHRNPGEYTHSSSPFRIPKVKNTDIVNNSQVPERVEFISSTETRSLSPEFPHITITGGGTGGSGVSIGTGSGPKRKVKLRTERRAFPEKRLRGNATGCNMQTAIVSPLPTANTPEKDEIVMANTPPQKYLKLNLKLNKCDSPKGRQEVKRLLSNLSSSQDNKTEVKSNGRLWKHTTAPKSLFHSDIRTDDSKPTTSSVLEVDTVSDYGHRQVSDTSLGPVIVPESLVSGPEMITFGEVPVTNSETVFVPTISVSGIENIHTPVSSVTEEPEEPEEMVYIGVCAHCGNPSLDLTQCDYVRCQKPINPDKIRTRTKKTKQLPVNTDTNIPRTLSGIKTGNFYVKTMNTMSSIYSDGDADTMFPVKPKKVLKTYGGRRKASLHNDIYRPTERVQQTASRWKARKIEEPVCVTISSDEDEPVDNIPRVEPQQNPEPHQNPEPVTHEPQPQPRSFVTSGDIGNEQFNTTNYNSQTVFPEATDSSIQNIEVSSSTIEVPISRKQKMKDEAGFSPLLTHQPSSVPVKRKRPVTPQLPSTEVMNSVILDLRGVRIGTLKIDCILAPVVITLLEISLQIVVDHQDIKLTIGASDLVHTEMFDGRPASLINLFTTAGAGIKIRDRCRMKKSSGWFDPGSMIDAEKRIILIAKKEPLHNTSVKAIHDIFSAIAEQNDIGFDKFLVKLSAQTANEILVANSNANPRKTEPTKAVTRVTLSGQVSDKQMDTVQLDEPRGFTGPILKLCVFPATPSPGAITITTEDLFCLNKDEFLNDVIIDFYLKYLIETVLSREDKERTHIFSSFFYKRLTQRPKRAHQEDTQKPIEHRRHSRVKNWTRHVKLFEKDFLIVPINESAHWYLAIICFPGLAVVSADEAIPAKEGQAVRLNTDKSNETKTNEEKCAKETVVKEADEEQDSGTCKEAEKEVSSEGQKVIDNDTDMDNDKTEQLNCEMKDTELNGVNSRDCDNHVCNNSLDQQPPAKIHKMEFADHFQTLVKDANQDTITNDDDSKQSGLVETDHDQMEKGEENVEKEGKDDSKIDENTIIDEEGRYETKMNVEGKAGIQIDRDGKESHSIEKEEKDNIKVDGEGMQSECKDVKERKELTDPSITTSTNANVGIQCKKPCILLFDSLLGPIHNNVVKILKEYLEIEWETKKSKDSTDVLRKELIRGSSVKVPQQSNYSDCGVFLLHYVEMFFKKPLQSFALPIQTLKEWFPEEEIPHKRVQIIQLINQLQKEQEEARRAR